MNVYYNRKGVGDVLIVPLQANQPSDVRYEKHGDITRILGEKDELLGYNIFNASEHFTLPKEGTIVVTDELLEEMKTLFEKENVNDPLDFDITPKFVIGHVLECEQHEDADKLKVCQVDVGEETLQIVCGAANVAKGQKVVVAKVGATMLSGLEIKATKLRGVSSSGMICSREELGLENPNNEEGILVLDDSYEIGAPFLFDI
ncbi:MAG TPA: DUF4479 domain-containing protein [Bacillota bacterium]|nr:DUF4479 domain-containing protein [Bacillota bacterium]